VGGQEHESLAKGCPEKRTSKRKGKSLFSLQELLSSNLEKTPKLSNSKSGNIKQKSSSAKKKKINHSTTDEEPELWTFLKQQLEAKKRKKMPSTHNNEEAGSMVMIETEKIAKKSS